MKTNLFLEEKTLKTLSCSFERINLGCVVPFAGNDVDSWQDSIRESLPCPRFTHRTAPKPDPFWGWSVDTQARMLALLWGGCLLDAKEAALQYAATIKNEESKKTRKL